MVTQLHQAHNTVAIINKYEYVGSFYTAISELATCMSYSVITFLSELHL